MSKAALVHFRRTLAASCFPWAFCRRSLAQDPCPRPTIGESASVHTRQACWNYREWRRFASP